MGAVYSLTLRQLTGRRRLAILAVLAALPVLISTLILGNAHAASVQEFEESILGSMLAGAIAPLVVLALAAAAFGNELEDRTLANLILSPLPRWRIVVPKLLAALTVAAPFIAASAALTAHVAYLADGRATLAVTLSALAAVALYTSAFLWLGLVSTQAIGLGLLYIVLWEGFFSTFVAGARMLSIRHYAIALMHALDARRFAFATHTPPWATVAVVAAVCAGFTLLSVRKLRRMDVP